MSKVTIYFIITTYLTNQLVSSASLTLHKSENAPDYRLHAGQSDVGEGRIFFNIVGQAISASGFFPIELNVPDMINAMIQGVQGAWDFMTSIFRGSSENQDAITHDPVDPDPVLDNSRHPSLHIKKTKKKKMKHKRANKSNGIYDFLEMDAWEFV